MLWTGLYRYILASRGYRLPSHSLSTHSPSVSAWSLQDCRRCRALFYRIMLSTIKQNLTA